MGRKGDPKMLLAVQARMANPDISLFEAIKRAGFNYPDDIDGKAVDDEGISLIQRKNQLSRRLRNLKTTRPPKPKREKTSQGGGGGGGAFADLVESQQASFRHLLHLDSAHTEMEDSCKQEVQRVPETDHDLSWDPHSNLTYLARKITDSFDEGTDSSLFSLVRQTSAVSMPLRTNGQPLCTEFGLRRLDRTCHSIGLTIDQLALILSTTDNLPERLGLSPNRPVEERHDNWFAGPHSASM